MDFTYGAITIEKYAKTKVPEGQKFIGMTESNFQDIRRVVTFRCIKCNRLFPYAQNTVLGPNIWKLSKNGLLFAAIILIAIFGLLGLLAI